MAAFIGPDMDALQTHLVKIEDWCKRKGSHLVYGSIEREGDLPIIRCASDRNVLESYLKALDALGPVTLIVDVKRLKEEDIQEKLDEISSLGDKQVRTDRLKAIEKCRSFVGNVAYYVMYAISDKPGLILKAEVVAEWYGSIY